MKLIADIQTQNIASQRRSGRKEIAVALVITLLFLSVITFLAIAFLAMTHRDRNAVVASLDVDTAKTMSDAALARAQTELVAQMMTSKDILSYDYLASHNFINPLGFNTSITGYNATNVNYDSLIPTGGATNALAWAENIGNLYYDPRPPVFVPTNSTAAGQPINDFRYWVDINRNGMFESNGWVQALNYSGGYILNLSNYYTGEPEWIGILKYPEYAHSPTNPFVGRYAFLVQPIGKTLDWNFIHNYAKMPGTKMALTSADHFIRDEGVGSWELNLAAMLNEINTNMYPPAPYTASFYNYNLNTGLQNNGAAFNDAVQFVNWRYASNYVAGYPSWLSTGLNYPLAIGLSNLNFVDIWGSDPTLNYPVDYNQYTTYPPISQNTPWPGSYNTNMYYDIQDIFDPNKTGANNANNGNGTTFSSRFENIMMNLDSYDRYTFQRLLTCIGMSSSPEYGVYVYPDFSITNPTVVPIPPQNVLRTKVNINFDNSGQIQVGPYGPNGTYTPMPTILTNWSAIGFFTNAAESLLRSQVYTFTNSPGPAYTGAPQLAAPNNFIYCSFGLTNIPVFNATNSGIVYTEQVHRMLQLAANIYAAAYPQFSGTGLNLVQQPPVFRPVFSQVPNPSGGFNLFITNYVQVTGLTAYNQMLGNWKDVTNSPILPNDNVWGIPWVVGAVKGVPEFDKYSYQNGIMMQRKLQFLRYPDTAHPGKYLTTKPQYTNQFIEMSLSNLFSMDAWNPYSNNFYGSSGNLTVYASNWITITLSNGYNFRTNYYISQPLGPTNLTQYSPFYWPGGNVVGSGMFKTFLQTNSIELPLSFYSESAQQFFPATGNYPTFDTNQTKWPTHHWVLTVTNHIFYVLFDGKANQGNVLDFVNLGPFGSSVPITADLENSTDPQWFGANQNNWWTVAPATDDGSGGMSMGVLNQISNLFIGNSSNTVFKADVLGTTGGDANTQGQFGPPPSYIYQPKYIGPYAKILDSDSWMANDPLVHYTLGDLTYPGYSQIPPTLASSSPLVTPPLTNGAGQVTTRYKTGVLNTEMLLGDPGMTNANAWQFPTNLFPGVGWLGRVHRGTPWQTIYLKPDNPTATAQPLVDWQKWVASPLTYPTNDWSLIDLFTAVPNDNAARGLLSVNQTNGAAWSAVLAGIIALTNGGATYGLPVGVPIGPSTDPANGYSTNVYTLTDYTNGTAIGINQARLNVGYNPNQLFHKIGDILQASTLTTQSPFITNAGPLNDETVERIPQQMLSLVKVGLPQFVIYSWGQSLKPKSLYSSASAPPYLNNICTNYEITGEYLTRMICHVVGDPGAGTPKIVVDNFNVEQGN